MTATDPGPSCPPSSPALGPVTIGQSPRADLRPDAEPPAAGVAPGGARGAGRRPVRRPGRAGDPWAARPRAGRGAAGDPAAGRGSVVLGHAALLPRIEKAIGRAERDGAAATLLLCTGRFPAVRAGRPVPHADPLLQHAVQAVAGSAPVGLLCPHPRPAGPCGRRAHGRRDRRGLYASCPGLSPEPWEPRVKHSSPIGVIRVLTSDDTRLVSAHGRVIEERYNLVTHSRCIPGQPRGIHDDESERRSHRSDRSRPPPLSALGWQSGRSPGERSRMRVRGC